MGHVEVFRMGSVRTSILKETSTPTRLATRSTTYTLVHEEPLGVTPDLTTFGKAVANGYPMAGVGGSAALMEHFSNTPGGTAYMGGTYNGHPALAAAGVATLDKLASEPVYEHINRLGDMVRSGLTDVFSALDVPVNVQRQGSIYFPFLLSGDVHDYRDSLRHDGDLLVRYRVHLLEDSDILETPTNFRSGKLTYAHTPADVEHLLSATARAVKTSLDERAQEAR